MVTEAATHVIVKKKDLDPPEMWEQWRPLLLTEGVKSQTELIRRETPFNEAWSVSVFSPESRNESLRSSVMTVDDLSLH